MSTPDRYENVLVIRLGALGDILLCMKPFQDIRMRYPHAKITLLTMPAFAGFARQMPWFDAVIEDERPNWWQFRAWHDLKRAIAGSGFDCVFDLQNKPRSRLYQRAFFKRKQPWSSSMGNSTFPLISFAQKMHRQTELLVQLEAAGVRDSGTLNLDWLSQSIEALNLPEKYIVLVPGCSPHLLHKRWPANYYAEFAHAFKSKGFETVVVGTKADAVSIADIKKDADFITDISGKTSFAELADVYRKASGVVGNDTGPTFLAAMVGAPTLTLMSHHTDPVRSGPIGQRCGWIKEENIEDIDVLRVVEKLSALI